MTFFLPATVIYTIILLGDETNKEVNFYHTLSFYLTFRIVHHRIRYVYNFLLRELFCKITKSIFVNDIRDFNI